MTTSRNITVALAVGLGGALLGLALLVAFVLPIGPGGQSVVGWATTDIAQASDAEVDANQPRSVSDGAGASGTDGQGASGTDGEGASGTTDAVAAGSRDGAGGDAAADRGSADGSVDRDRTIGREEAGRIAAAHLGGGSVDDISRESDYGAAWDVDVYAPDGDYTVYVSANGEVLRVDGPW
jgi:uncharacterized membrane protein YkoI